MFSNLLAKIGAILAAPLIFISSFFGTPEVPQTPIETQLGGFQTVGGVPYYLYGSGVGTSDTSITLTKFRIAGNDSQKLTMTDFGDTGYLTLEPGNTTRQEFVSFTGVSQNSDGTATLTGVTRGLAPVSPYTASSTLQKAHAGGSIAVISNPPQLYEELATRSNNETITGLWRFNTLLPESTLTATSSSQFITLGQANGIATQGAATSTESRGGIVELATQLEQASSTDLGATQPLVLQAKNASTTPGSVNGNYVIVSKFNRKLDQLWLDLTEAFTWTGLHSFTGGTTSVTSLSASTGSTTIRSIPYFWPFSQGTASTTLVNDGSGNLSWKTLGSGSFVFSNSSGGTTFSSNASTTILNQNIPANTLGTDNIIEVTIPISSLGFAANTGRVWFEFSYGASATSTCTISASGNTGAISGMAGTLEVRLAAAASTGSQKSSVLVRTIDDGTAESDGAPVLEEATCSAFTTHSADSTTDKRLVLITRNAVNGAGDGVTWNFIYSNIIK